MIQLQTQFEGDIMKSYAIVRSVLGVVLVFSCFSCDTTDPEDKGSFGNCSATNIYDYLDKDLRDTELLTSSTWGNEIYWRPTFLDIRLDLQSIMEPEVYNERIWLGSLWSIAARFAYLNGDQNAIKNSQNYAELVDKTGKLIDEAQLLTKLPAQEKFVRMLPLIKEFGQAYRDFLCDYGTFTTRNANIRYGWENLGAVLSAFSIFFNAYEAYSEREAIDKIVNDACTWGYLRVVVLPAISASNLPNQYPSLQRAMLNYMDAYTTYRDDQYDIILQNLMYNSAASLSGLLLGLEGGGYSGATLSYLCDYSAEQVNNGAEFIYNFDVASRLFTLSRGLPVNGDVNTSLCRSVALDQAVSLIKYHIIGYGVIQLVAGGLGIGIDNAEKKWNAYLENVYSVAENDIQTCMKSQIESSGNGTSIHDDDYAHIIEEGAFKIRRDKHGDMWLLLHNGVAKYNYRSFEKYYITDDEGSTPVDINIDESGEIYVAYRSGRIDQYDNGKWKPFYTDHKRLPWSAIYCFHKSLDGSLYFGGYGSVIKYASGEYKTIAGNSGINPSTYSISETADGKIWIVKYGPLTMYDPIKDTAVWVYNTDGTGLTSQALIRGRVDEKDNLWIGALWSGAFRYHEGSWKHYYDGLSIEKAWEAIEDEDGEIWIGTSSGARRIKKDGSVKVYSKADDVAHNTMDDIYSVEQDKNGDIWMSGHFHTYVIYK